jgi:hypothetical protein
MTDNHNNIRIPDLFTFYFSFFTLNSLILLLLFMDLCNLLSSHELTPFFSPSLLRKEGECSDIQYVTPPLCGAERGMLSEVEAGGEFMGKINSVFGHILRC